MSPTDADAKPEAEEPRSEDVSLQLDPEEESEESAEEQDRRAAEAAFTERLHSDEATRALVERAQSGDCGALNELFASYHGFMVEMARRRLGSRLRLKEEADDLAQTTFREATRDFGRYRYQGEGSLLRWLLQILQNKIRDKAEYYGAGKRDISRERTIESTQPSDEGRGSFREPSAPDLSVTRVVQRKEEFGLLREALEDLSPDHRKAITLVFFQGLTLKQAGEQMGGRTEDAVRMLLRRAEGRLRELMEPKLGS